MSEPKERPKLNKVQRLQLAAKAAEILRNANAPSVYEPRKKIRTEGGKVYSMHEWRIKLLEKRLLEAGIEIEVGDAYRPIVVRCGCGMLFIPNARGRLGVRCPDCLRCTNVIDGNRCRNALGRQAWAPSSVAARRGRPPVCKLCARRVWLERQDPAALRERVRVMREKVTDESKARSLRHLKERLAAMTPEEKRARMLHARSRLDPKKASEARAEAAKRETAEQRRDRGLKAWKTRQSRSAP